MHARGVTVQGEDSIAFDNMDCTRSSRLVHTDNVKTKGIDTYRFTIDPSRQLGPSCSLAMLAFWFPCLLARVPTLLACNETSSRCAAAGLNNASQTPQMCAFDGYQPSGTLNIQAFTGGEKS